MKRTILICFIAVVTGSLHVRGQFFFVEIPMGPSETVTCDGGSISNINSYWTGYQTLNDEFDGELMEGTCIGLNLSGNLILNAYDSDKPVFIRYSGPPVAMQPDQAYSIYTDGVSMNSLDLWDISTCLNAICNGAIVGVEVPDDPDDGDELPEIRWHSLELYDEAWKERHYGCFASEKFEQQHMRELIFKFNFLEDVTSFPLGWIALRESESWYMSDIEDSGMSSNNQVYLNGGGTIIRHDLPGFPSEAHVDTTFLNPFSNPDIQQAITLNIQPGEWLIFQPFTYLQGGEVEGQNNVYHPLSILANGGNVCISQAFWELVAEPGEMIQIIDTDFLMNRGSCIRIEKDAMFRIGPGADYEFGLRGTGMLALHSGARLELLEESTFELNTMLVLFDNSWENEPQPVEVYLRPGQIWRFGLLSSLDNRSVEDKMKVIFHMNGGLLDLGPLTEEERRSIEVRWPAHVQSALSIHRAIPQGEGEWLLEWNSPGEEEILMECYDTCGKLLESTRLNALEGYNQVRITCASLSGIGVVTLRNASGNSDSVLVFR
jgi:hypothetical protein